MKCMLYASPKEVNQEELDCDVSALEKLLKRLGRKESVVTARSDFRQNGSKLVDRMGEAGWQAWADSTADRFDSIVIPVKSRDAKSGSARIGRGTAMVVKAAYESGLPLFVFVTNDPQLKPITGADTIDAEDYRAGYSIEIGS